MLGGWETSSLIFLVNVFEKMFSEKEFKSRMSSRRGEMIQLRSSTTTN